MISVSESSVTIARHVRPIGTTFKPLDQAVGLCLAEGVRADRDIPPADRSAMDGYAVRSSDLKQCPCDLRLIGEVAAGSPASVIVNPGTCIRVLTGANIPKGADTVIMVERTREAGSTVTFLEAAKRGANIRPQGEEAKKKSVVLAEKTLLGPPQIGLCASVGKSELKVYRLPRVAVLCTGDELKSAGARVRSHQLRDSNGPMLCASLRSWGFPDVVHDTVSDDPKRLASKLKRLAARRDVVLLTGGVSVGKYDFVPEAVKRIGATVRFHGVAIKPGKPILYATLPGNKHVFGLSGPPISAMVGFNEFALPALRLLSGLERKQCRPSMKVPIRTKLLCKKRNVLQFILASLFWSNGDPTVKPILSHGSADLVAGGQSDGVIAVPPNTRQISSGTKVEFHPWRPLR